MYDEINFKQNCPVCGSEIASWQSKDGDCCLETLEITDVDNFYDICDNCKAWIEYTRKEGKKDSHQTLLEAKKIFASIIIDLNDGRTPLAHDLQEAIYKFMKDHPLPQNSIDDFEITIETKEERSKRIQKELENLPSVGGPDIHIEPLDFFEEDEKD